jgi:uncharacterized membrane protein YkvA (DUF1232 family)
LEGSLTRTDAREPGGVWSRWKQRARQLKLETWALYLAVRHPRTPWYARLFALCVVAYALSPIDLVPDFIPVLGYLDDLILVPLGLALALRMVPQQVLDECREQARRDADRGKLGWQAGIVVVLTWALLAGLALLLAWRAARR